LLTAGGRLYLWANFIGGVLLCIAAINVRQAGFIILEGAWALISLIGLIRVWQNSGASDAEPARLKNDESKNDEPYATHEQNTLARFCDGRVTICVGDLTEQSVDAIVNAANSTLLGGGGVDGAIHRRGGAEILRECEELRRTTLPGGLPTGEAVITTGGRLPARYVIHTVGPIWGREGGREAELLAACYRNSLQVGVENGLSSIAFPAISTGAFGYPGHEAAQVASTAVRDFLHADDNLAEVRFVFILKRDAASFLKHHCFDQRSEKTVR
jgi:O-acetyl-ADP-ribose deacetylase (regulator of RNase III)